MSAINRKSLTVLRSCCKTSSEKTRTRPAWCMALPVFRSARQSSWKSFSKWRGKTALMIPVFRTALVVSSMLVSFQLLAQTQEKEASVEYPTFYRTTEIDGLSIFYREAGAKDAPTILLL